MTSVRIFVSDFGKERLEEEARLGPAELRVAQDPEAEGEEVKDDIGDDTDEDDQEERLMPNSRKEKAAEVAAMARVRQYQVFCLRFTKKFSKWLF